MCSLINKQLLLTAYAYLSITEQQKAQQGSEALQLQVESTPNVHPHFARYSDEIMQILANTWNWRTELENKRKSIPMMSEKQWAHATVDAIFKMFFKDEDAKARDEKLKEVGKHFTAGAVEDARKTLYRNGGCAHPMSGITGLGRVFCGGCGQAWQGEVKESIPPGIAPLPEMKVTKCKGCEQHGAWLPGKIHGEDGNIHGQISIVCDVCKKKDLAVSWGCAECLKNDICVACLGLTPESKSLDEGLRKMTEWLARINEANLVRPACK